MAAAIESNISCVRADEGLVLQVTAMSDCMVVRDEMREAVEEIAEVADAWKRAYEDWQRTVEERDRAAERMQRRVTKATGGLSVARWEVVCRRRRARTVEDAKAKARAIRARPVVEAAIGERHEVIAEADAKVLAARIELALASKAVARYGRTGLSMIGQSATELRRLSRLPPST